MTTSKSGPAPAKKPAAAIKGPYDAQLHRLRMPIETIQIASCNGLMMGSIVEFYGNSKSGKSTTAYQAAEMFLADYGDRAELLVIDAEGAAKNIARMMLAFNLDFANDPRIHVEPGFIIEDANDHIQRYGKRCKAEGKFLLIIWDSITASSFANSKKVIDEAMAREEGTKDSVAERGMTEPMARAQVLKWCLNQTLHAVYRAPITVILINQITTKVKNWGVTTGSAGGYAVEHNPDERYKFEFVKSVGGEAHQLGQDLAKNAVFKTGTMSRVSVEKSRSVPGLMDIPILINDTIGGRIVPEQELPLVATRLGVFETKSGGWYNLKPEYLPPEMKPWEAMKSLKQIFESPEAIADVRVAVTQYFRKTFKLVDYEFTRYEEAAAKKAVAPAKDKA